MRGSLNLGKIFGIRVLVHFTFVLIFVYVGYYNFQMYHSIPKLLYMFLVILLVFACVLMHEFGHALAARRIGINTRQILILPIGGMAQIDTLPEKPKDELFVTICGPLVNLGIVLVLLPIALIWYNIQEILFFDDFGQLLPDIISCNIILFIFNLVPAYPMDGGRIFRALLALKLKYKTATLIAARTGQLIAVSVACILFFYYFNNTLGMGNIIKMLVLCAFIVVLAEMEYRSIKHRHAAEKGISGVAQPAGYNVPHHGLLVSDSLAEAVHRFRQRTGNLPVIHNGQVAGFITTHPPEVQNANTGTYTNSVYWSASNTYHFTPADSIGHALKMMELLDIPALALSAYCGSYNGDSRECFLVKAFVKS
jgi:Zn-dependent protease